MATLIERYTLLEKASKDRELQKQCIIACRADIVFWFNHFAYTFDPREAQADLPFNLMPFQELIAKETALCIKTAKRGNRQDCLYEKSRDVGISWELGLIFQYFWQFFPGFNFMIGSKKEQDVDAKGDMSSFMQKIRYNISMQPAWMLPKLGKNHDSHLKLIHPVNGNSITGESSTAGFARGKRYSGIIIDEMAFHPYGKQAWETAWQSSYCILLPSTPNGKANEYFKLRERIEEWVDFADCQPELIRELAA